MANCCGDQTPTGRANEALSKLESVLEVLGDQIDKNFVEEAFRTTWNDDAGSGAKWEAGIFPNDIHEDPKDKLGYRESLRCLMQMAVTVCAYCADAMKAEERGDISAAWTNMVDAAYWLGMVTSMTGEYQFRDIPIAQRAQRAANVRHQGARQLREQALAWYEENKARFRSKDQAAEAMTKIFPVAFRTLRDWLAVPANK